ncbi:MAG: PHP domain-containing protein, partial [Coxiellaceae bacterium]|nr:PHP domain-containing protein [Coxiellaceae bacterium]
MSAFVHLHCHTEFSLVDGITRIKPLVAACKDMGMSAVAVTDFNNLFGMVKFYKAATAAGIKPIIGADVLVQRESLGPTCHLLLLCQNHAGYLNLSKLISRAYVEGQVNDVPIIARAWLENAVDGLLALSGGTKGDIGCALIQQQTDVAQAHLNDWCQLFPNRFYLEVHRVGIANEETYIDAVIPLAERQQVPVVATNCVRFLTEQDFEAHEARVCINSGHTLDDATRPREYTEQQFCKSPLQMQTLFSDIPEALANTVEIAKRCTLELELGKNYLPDYPIPDGMTIDQYMRQVSTEGLDNRLAKLFDVTADNFPAIKQKYQARLDLELDVINNMGFPGYFLIVADFIRWAKANAIPV